MTLPLLDHRTGHGAELKGDLRLYARRIRRRGLTFPYRGGFTIRPMITANVFMTIGEAARRSGFTIKALRFYERRGILPASHRGVNGYRLYSQTDLQRLSFIRDAKALGLTLGAIGDIVSASQGTRRKRLLGVLDHRIAEATDRIGALTRLREELERRRHVVTQGRSDGKSADCSCLKQSEPSG